MKLHEHDDRVARRTASDQGCEEGHFEIVFVTYASAIVDQFVLLWTPLVQSTGSSTPPLLKNGTVHNRGACIETATATPLNIFWRMPSPIRYEVLKSSSQQTPEQQ
jgi:hypothetical protein